MRRWLPSWRLVLGTFLALGALGVGALVALYLVTPIPKPGDFAEAQTTTVYYSDGTTKMGTFSAQNRVILPSDKIPEDMKQAAVAGEDRTFYKNPGIDPVGILRALYTDVRYGTRQGGSSITQQYAERYYFDKTVSSYTGKLKEAILAVKLDRQQDKDEILSNYLNTIYFGRDSYGVQTAAQSYFGVDAADLTTAQAALLAAVIPSPNNFDPRVSMAQAERRWNYVLDGMVTTGALTQTKRDALQFPETIEYAKSDKLKGPQGYLLTMVQNELETKAGITSDQLNSVGYKVVTTIDPTLQNELVDTMSNMPKGARPEPARRRGHPRPDGRRDRGAVRRPGLPDPAAQRGDAGRRRRRVHVQALHARGVPGERRLAEVQVLGQEQVRRRRLHQGRDQLRR